MSKLKVEHRYVVHPNQVTLLNITLRHSSLGAPSPLQLAASHYYYILHESNHNSLHLDSYVTQPGLKTIA